jgi:hypothetical protein
MFVWRANHKTTKKVISVSFLGLLFVPIFFACIFPFLSFSRAGRLLPCHPEHKREE